MSDFETNEPGENSLEKAYQDGLSETYTPAAPAPQKPTLRGLFFGDDGLRAGWSVLLFLLLVAATGVAVFLALKYSHHLPPKSGRPDPHAAAKPLAPRTQVIGEAVQFMLFALPAFLMSLIERRSFGRYGLALRSTLKDFLIGLCWGFAMLSLLIGALFATHSIAFDGVLLHGAPALLYAAKWGLVFFLVGLSEEFIFRGYLQYTVARGIAGITRTMSPGNRHTHVISFWGAAFLFSFLFFILAHTGNPGETIWGLLQVGLAGITFAFSLWRTGTLWWAIGFHTAWDWAQSYFYGTADSGTITQGHLLATHAIGRTLLSGGADGPEGSLLCVPALLLTMLVIHLTLPRRVYPLTPDQSEPAQSEPLAYSPGAVLLPEELG